MASNIATATLSGAQGGTITLSITIDAEKFIVVDGDTTVFTVGDSGNTPIGHPSGYLNGTDQSDSDHEDLDVTSLNLQASTTYKFNYDEVNGSLIDNFGFENIPSVTNMAITNNITEPPPSGGASANNNVATFLMLGLL